MVPGTATSGVENNHYILWKSDSPSNLGHEKGKDSANISGLVMFCWVHTCTQIKAMKMVASICNDGIFPQCFDYWFPVYL